MTCVILGDQLGSLQRELDGRTGPMSFVQLTMTQESSRVSDFLRQRPDCHEVSAGEYFRKRRDSYSKKYLRFIDRLNQANHSLEWWGMPITDKMPTGPDLCRDIASFLLVVELSQLHYETLVVISDSVELGAQVKLWAQKEGTEAVVLIQQFRTLSTLLKEYSPAGIFLAFLKTVLSRWLYSRRFRPPEITQEEHVVIHSLSHVSSFREAGSYRDAYFGPLVDYLTDTRRKALVFAGIQEQPRTQLKKLKEIRGGIPILPVESCVSIAALISILVRALSSYVRSPRVNGGAVIDGLDVSYLVNNVVQKARHSGNLFMNLLVFYASKKLARSIPISRWLYPFENLAWEKMLLLGTRSSGHDIRMIGYQHASITKSNATYQSMVLPEDQKQAIPFPNAVVTTGDVTHEWLEKEGHYSTSTEVKAACALRPAFLPLYEPKRREPHLSKILVALATNQDEYVRVLVFLEQAFSGVSGYEVRVRPHPVIPFEPALKAASLSSTSFFHVSSGTLQEDLRWANVVLYASSTVGLEAISLGVPAINLDLGNFLDEDPMLGWSEFRWPAIEPCELVKTIKHIETIPEDEFRALQQKGQEYATAYLKPVTEKGLRSFLED
jgi:surface carbohydrate biosynthesis protein (TIGR04326 family)